MPLVYPPEALIIFSTAYPSYTKRAVPSHYTSFTLIMSLATSAMSKNREGAIRETFKAAVNAVPERLRDSFILIGGAATFLSGVTERHTSDLDFAAGREAMNAFLKVVMNKERGFKMDDDFTVTYWTSYEFFVQIDLHILGRDFVTYVESLQRLESGFLASIPDLLLLRSITIEERGVDKDLDDFVDLMRLARQ